MREAFETAPRDGKVVILEDDASGTYEAARWSAEAGEWVGEDGEPIKITPTHWYDSFLSPRAGLRHNRRRRATSLHLVQLWRRRPGPLRRSRRRPRRSKRILRRMRGSDLQLPRSTQLSTDTPVDTVFLGLA